MGCSNLLQYPHGCVEQTSSRVLPLATMRKMAGQGLVPGLTPEMTDPYIASGVARTAVDADRVGRIRILAGDKSPHPFGSAYASMTLALAKQAGAEVPEAALKRAAGYLTGILDQKVQDAHYAMPFAHYALTLCGQPAGAPADWRKLAGRFSHEERLFLWMAAARAGAKTDAKAGVTQILADLKVRGELTAGNPTRSGATEGRARGRAARGGRDRRGRRADRRARDGAVQVHRAPATGTPRTRPRGR